MFVCESDDYKGEKQTNTKRQEPCVYTIFINIYTERQRDRDRDREMCKQISIEIYASLFVYTCVCMGVCL